ncbi:MAG TPA: class I SAM-dependent methyltransferase [Caulobacteraceae bacterium]
MADPLRALASINGRFAPALARTMLASPRATADAAAFAAHAEAQGFEFTDLWADNNIPFVASVLRRFAEGRDKIAYLEIGAYEGRNLAFMDWLLPGKLEVTVIDPWFDETLNPEEKYHAVEPRFQRNTAKLGFRSLDTHKGFSTYELPRMLEAGRSFDLIYVDGTHTALGVMIDLCFCAALLSVGGLMVLDDYWRQQSEIGGPGVKQAVDRFHGAFRRYFELEAVYRQVILRKTADIPR